MKQVIKKKQQPNYTLRAKVLENGCSNLTRKLSLASWKRYQEKMHLEDTGEITTALELNEKLVVSYREQLSNYSAEEIKEAEKVNDASYHRIKRLKDRVLTMLKNENCIFLTLTFRDDVLANTSEETRKKYIQRFLKEHCSLYVANIDYGSKKGREHYHAVVIPKDNEIDGSFYRKQCGNIDFERVRNKGNADNEATSKRLAKYVSKLVNHAIKETTRKCQVIYSR